MGKYRIVDTRFRILKKGKIALACAIAIGGLSVSTTSAHATDYFQANTIYNGRIYTDGNGLSGDYSAADRVYLQAVSNATNVTSSDSVVFAPVGTTSYWSGVKYGTLIGDPYVGSTGSGTFIVSGDCFYYQNVAFGVAASYTITFDAGDTATNIYKVNAINYSTGSIPNVDPTVAYTTLSNPTYTANLVFNGVNTVTGYTDIADGTITIAGSNVNFAGTVTAGNISIGGSGIYFNSLVKLSDTMTYIGGYSTVLHAGMSGDVNFAGNNGTLTLDTGNINGSVDTTSSKSGTLVFGTSGTSEVTDSIGSTAALKEIQLNGRGTVGVHDTHVAIVNFNNSGILDILSGTVDTTSSTSGRIDFNNYAGTINVYDGVTINSNILSTDGSNGSTASVSNSVNFRNSATMKGDIGSSTSRIANVNIGMNVDASTGTVDMNGDIYATQVKFNDVDALVMSSGKNITGTVVTKVNGEGILTLAGGTQSVSGQIGTDSYRLNTVNSGKNGATSTFSGDVYAANVTNTGTGTSNFAQSVTATNINVDNGTSNFDNNVTATTTTIDSGIGNFNTNGTGTTTSNILFSDTGTANLHTGLTGAVNFNRNNATVNVWDAKGISGAITTTTDNTGILNYRGDGTIASTVGASGFGIHELNINTNSDLNTTTGVLAQGDIFANTVNLKNSGILTLADTVDVTTTKVTTDTTNTGVLTLQGTSVINGQVGESNKILATINAGATSKTSTFNGMVYADTLRYSGNGTVVLNGTNNGVTDGMVGTVDFNTGTGTLQIGDDVNLTVGASGIQFANANAATLVFNGSSVVNGVLGGDLNATTRTTNTFSKIYAGANGETVTFKNDVYVMENTGGSLTTFYVNGTGTVNFEGNLHGDLVYSQDGTVNVSNGKSISVLTPNLLAISTDINQTGTLNYLGSTTLDTDIGTSSLMLKSVAFNTDSNNVTQTINKNIYADTVTIGGSAGTTAISVADVTGVYDYAGGTNMYAFTGGTTANIDGNVTFGGNLVIANATTAVNYGISHVTVAGDMTTNGSAMSFRVNTNDISDNNATSTSSGSAKVTVAGNLNMNGSEKIIVNYLGSLANNGSYTLIDAAGGTTTTSYDKNETGGLVKDNSYSIDTRVATNTSGDLIVYADRTGGGTYAANQNYIVKSSTQGSYSNNAAAILGGIAAEGTQTGDMVQVIQKLDIDSFGYGDTQANLAKQVQRLAPVVNNSITLSTMGSTTLALNSVSNRMSELKGTSVATSSTAASASGLSAGDDSLGNGVWAKVIGTAATQDKVGQYDGYKTNSYGMAIGADKKLDTDMIIGLALGYTNSDIDQQDFRSGDTAKVKSYQLMAYASKEFGKAYLEGALAYGMHNTDASRATAIGRIAQASIDANQYSARLAAGYRVDLQNKLTLTPFASFDYAHLVQDAYSETGAGALNLNVNEVTTDRSKLGLGLRIGSEWEQNSGKLQADLKLAAYQYLGSDSADVTAQFAGGGAKFVTPGVSSDDTLYNIGLGVKYQMSKTTSLGLSLDYDRSSDGSFNGYTGSLMARKIF